MSAVAEAFAVAVADGVAFLWDDAPARERTGATTDADGTNVLDGTEAADAIADAVADAIAEETDVAVVDTVALGAAAVLGESRIVTTATTAIAIAIPVTPRSTGTRAERCGGAGGGAGGIASTAPSAGVS